MAEPFAVLGLPPDSDDETIRRRYLELVREHPPEHSPARFAEIRQAYESLKDMNTRLSLRLFNSKDQEKLEQIIEELECRTQPRRRLSLKTLISLQKPRQ